MTTSQNILLLSVPPDKHEPPQHQRLTALRLETGISNVFTQTSRLIAGRFQILKNALNICKARIVIVPRDLYLKIERQRLKEGCNTSIQDLH